MVGLGYNKFRHGWGIDVHPVYKKLLSPQSNIPYIALDRYCLLCGDCIATKRARSSLFWPNQHVENIAA